MSAVKDSLSEELHEKLKIVEKEIGIREIEPFEEEIKEFCDIIDDNNPLYFKKSIFPPGYIMNLTNRVIQEVFIKIGHITGRTRRTGIREVSSYEDQYRIQKKGRSGNRLWRSVSI